MVHLFYYKNCYNKNVQDCPFGQLIPCPTFTLIDAFYYIQKHYQIFFKKCRGENLNVMVVKI